MEYYWHDQMATTQVGWAEQPATVLNTAEGKEAATTTLVQAHFM